jgi:hypothetical protein
MSRGRCQSTRKVRSMKEEDQRKKKVEDYFNETEKKDQCVIISKLIQSKRILSLKVHNDEMKE